MTHLFDDVILEWSLVHPTRFQTLRALPKMVQIGFIKYIKGLNPNLNPLRGQPDLIRPFLDPEGQPNQFKPKFDPF